MKLARKLVEVMKAVESVPKNGWNDHFKYSFAQDTDILRVIRTALIAQNLVFTTSIIEERKKGNITTVKTAHDLSTSALASTVRNYSVDPCKKNANIDIVFTLPNK